MQMQYIVAEQKRLEQEREERERKRALNEIKQIKDSQTEHGQKILKKLDEDDIKKLDADQIIAKKAEEFQAKLKSQEKKVDYFEHAKWLEEIPLLQAAMKERQLQDQNFWEQQEKERIAAAIEERKLAVTTRDRFLRMKPDKDEFLAKLKKERNIVYEDQLKEFENLLSEERRKRLQERKAKRKEERHTQWFQEKEEEAECKAKDQSCREEEERERVKEAPSKEHEEKKRIEREKMSSRRGRRDSGRRRRKRLEEMRQHILAEQKHLEEEREKGERKRALNEIKQIKDSQTEHWQKILKKLDEDDIKKLQKERRKLQAKFKSQEKKMDCFERAKRLEEIPLLQASMKERQLQEQQEKERIAAAIEELKLAVTTRDRLARMKPDKDEFLTKLKKERNIAYENKLIEFENFLSEERRKRLRERKAKRKEVMRTQWRKEKKEEAERKAKEQRGREEEERQRVEKAATRERKEKKRIEMEERERKIKEQLPGSSNEKMRWRGSSRRRRRGSGRR